MSALERKETELSYPADFINTFVCGDTLEVMRKMPDASIDLVVTSPPYNLSLIHI